MSQHTFDNLVVMFFMIISLFITFVFGYLTIKVIFADGKADYCVVRDVSRGARPSFELTQHVPYQSDRSVGTFESIFEAKAAADLISCQIK